MIKRRAVGPSDVAISIKYAGICHSDIHTVREEWGPISYPLAPGHEIGTVKLYHRDSKKKELNALCMLKGG